MVAWVCGGWLENWRVMLILTQVVVEVDVEVGNRCTVVAWFTTFLVGWWVAGWLGVESENKAISAVN